MAKKSAHDSVLGQLRTFGLAYPGAHYKSPWPGHMDLAVNDKTFAYLSLEGEPLSISCKLPHSSGAALVLPFTQPTGYGLGKSGWVTATYAVGDGIDLEMLKAWIDESYRAQAPKKLVRALDEGGIAEKKASTPKTSSASQPARVSKTSANGSSGKSSASKAKPARKKASASKKAAR